MSSGWLAYQAGRASDRQARIRFTAPSSRRRPGACRAMAPGMRLVFSRKRSTSASVKGLRFTRIVDSWMKPGSSPPAGGDPPRPRPGARARGAPCHVAGGAVRLAFVGELPELHREDAAVGEVFEALLDHLGRIEVALRQHEGARGRGVLRRVAVGCDEVDQVVAPPFARQEGAGLRVHQPDARIRSQVSAVVREVLGEKRDGRGVELQGRHLLSVEEERSQDLVAARGSDDQDAADGLLGDPEGVGARVARRNA